MGRKKKNKYLYSRLHGYITTYRIDNHIDGEWLIDLENGNGFKKDEYLLWGESSENILNLLKDGDIVEIEFYDDLCKRRIKKLFIVNRSDPAKMDTTNDAWPNMIDFENMYIWLTYDLADNRWLQEDKKYNPRIKRILTAEEFERRSIGV